MGMGYWTPAYAGATESNVSGGALVIKPDPVHNLGRQGSLFGDI